MLSRLKMNIEDCISEFRLLGETVFTHKRSTSLRSLPKFNGEKYDYRKLERAIKQIVSKRQRFYDPSLQTSAFLADSNGPKT